MTTKPKPKTAPRPTRHTMPPGLYIVGDPCYSAADNSDPTDKLWGEYLAAINGGDDQNYNGGFGTCRGHDVCAFGTAYGDGEYDDNEGHCYGVDAGLLGLVPLALAVNKAPRGTRIVDFPKTFTCSRTASGTIRLGHITIKTG